jgi:hypothetical protein
MTVTAADEFLAWLILMSLEPVGTCVHKKAKPHWDCFPRTTNPVLRGTLTNRLRANCGRTASIVTAENDRWNSAFGSHSNRVDTR